MRPVGLLLLLLLSALGCRAGQLPCPFEGQPDHAPSAGCLLAVHGRILVVENAVGQVSPPGGKSRPGESAQCAAHRETFEETGLDVRPGALAATFATGFKLYYCDIHADSGTLRPQDPLEIRRVYWLPLDQVESASWRFQGQGVVLEHILREHSDAGHSEH